MRGLDYYVRTTFEIVSGDIGSQSSVAGGGRYDGLVHSIGGPDVPGVGFACGMERLALLIDKAAEPGPDFALVVLDAAGLERGLLLAQELRAAGFAGEAPYAAKSAKSQMRAADKSKAAFCLVLGADELAAGTVVVKNMRAGGQETVGQALLAAYLRARLEEGEAGRIRKLGDSGRCPETPPGRCPGPCQGVALDPPEGWIGGLGLDHGSPPWPLDPRPRKSDNRARPGARGAASGDHETVDATQANASWTIQNFEKGRGEKLLQKSFSPQA